MSRAAHLKEYHWKAGKSGNPSGVSKEMNRLNKKFVLDIRRRWNKDGEQCLDRMIEEDPSGFVRLMFSTLPKNVHLDQHVDVEMTWVQALQALPSVHAQLEDKERTAIEGQFVKELNAAKAEPKQ